MSRQSFITAKGGIVNVGNKSFHFRVFDNRFFLKAIYHKNIEVYNFDDEIDAYFGDTNARLRFINNCYNVRQVSDLVHLCESYEVEQV